MPGAVDVGAVVVGGVLLGGSAVGGRGGPLSLPGWVVEPVLGGGGGAEPTRELDADGPGLGALVPCVGASLALAGLPSGVAWSAAHAEAKPATTALAVNHRGVNHRGVNHRGVKRRGFMKPAGTRPSPEKVLGTEATGWCLPQRDERKEV
jgi:hypothetical protein